MLRYEDSQENVKRKNKKRKPRALCTWCDCERNVTPTPHAVWSDFPFLPSCFLTCLHMYHCAKVSRIHLPLQFFIVADSCLTRVSVACVRSLVAAYSHRCTLFDLYASVKFVLYILFALLSVVAHSILILLCLSDTNLSYCKKNAYELRRMQYQWTVIRDDHLILRGGACTFWK